MIPLLIWPAIEATRLTTGNSSGATTATSLLAMGGGATVTADVLTNAGEMLRQQIQGAATQRHPPVGSTLMQALPLLLKMCQLMIQPSRPRVELRRC